MLTELLDQFEQACAEFYGKSRWKTPDEIFCKAAQDQLIEAREKVAELEARLAGISTPLKLHAAGCRCTGCV